MEQNTKFISFDNYRSHNIFDKIISLDNLFLAWREFKRGKENKKDVQEFALNPEDNIFNLHRRLKNNNYLHSNYKSFYVCDPKLRHIHKASVIDRILHHAMVKIIEPIFEKSFIFDSYSNRKNKGTHRAIKRLKIFAWKLSRNNTKNVWVLKCDIKKFFENVNHDILIGLIKKKISNNQVIELISKIIYSFKGENKKGIPLGNLTSQIFSNVYLNELDQFIKRKLRIKYYLRYTDDFVILSDDDKNFHGLILKINEFLESKLDLQIHPQKVMIKKWKQGIDFLGYVDFPYYNILRTKTKNRILKRIKNSNYQSIQSYFGVLKHCRSSRIKTKIEFIIGNYNFK